MSFIRFAYGIVCACLILSGCSGQENAAARERTWSDNTGKQTVVASLVKQTQTHATLRKRDETLKTVPITALSETDQQFLRSLHRTADAAGEGKAISLDERKRWTYRPRNTKVLIPKIKRIAKSYDPDSHLTYKFSADGRWVALTVKGESGRDVSVVNLEDGTVKKTEDLPEGGVSGIHNDGAHLAISRSYNDETNKRKRWLEYWIVKPDGQVFYSTKRALSFGYMGPLVGGRHVKMGRRRTQAENTVTIVDWKTRKTAFEITAPAPGPDPTLDIVDISADEKTLAVRYRTTIFLIDANTGAVKGSFRCPNGSQPLFFKFSPDGTRFAGAAYRFVYLWDLKRQAERTIVMLPEYEPSRRPLDKVETGLAWADDRFLVAFGVLVDTRISYPVWKYLSVEYRSGMTLPRVWEKLRHISGRQFFSIQSTNDETVFMPIQLPHDKAMAHTIEPEDIIRVEPGDKIRLETDFSLLSDFEEMKLNGLLKTMLESRGYVVSNDADVLFTATITKNAPRDITIRDYVRVSRKVAAEGSDEDNTFQVTTHTASVAVRAGEHTLFSADNSDLIADGRLVVRHDETVEQALERLSAPDAQFFRQVRLPIRFSALRTGKRMGVSQIELGEIRDLD